MKKGIIKMMVSICALLCIVGVSLCAYAADTVNITELATLDATSGEAGETVVKIVNNTSETVYYAVGNASTKGVLYFSSTDSYSAYGEHQGSIVAGETLELQDSRFNNIVLYSGNNPFYGWTPPSPYPAPAPAPQPELLAESEPAPIPHVHSFVTGTIYEATCDHDGLEGTYCSTCGFIKESSPISAFGYTLETYAQQKMDVAKSGQTIVLEFGELSSFPKSFMEKIAQKVAAGVSFEFRYKVNHKLQKIKIPAYSTVDTSLDWYGYGKMAELYGMN